MSACNDINAWMIDWLYEELDESKSAEFDQHLAGCPRCRQELESLQHTRAAVRDLPEIEPPASLSAILLHEAAKRAPAPAKRAVALAVDDGRAGWFDRLTSWLAPMVRHPAAAAIATLVLVAGVAGSLYLREVKVTEPHATSPTSEPTPVDLPAVAIPAPVDLATRGQRELEPDYKDGYAVQLADEGDFDLRDPAPSASAKSPGRGETEKSEVVAKRAPQKVEARLEGKNDDRAGFGFDDSLANAVSGADERVAVEETTRAAVLDRELEASGEVLGGTSVAGNTRHRDSAGKPAPDAKPTDKKKAAERAPVVSQTQPAPPPRGESGATAQAEPAQQAYRVYDAKRELEWAQTEGRKLAEALRGQRCRDAARIANDILDRNPEYYAQTIERSKDLKKCQWYVGDERDRRARQRSKARPKNAAPDSPAEADALVE